MRNEFEEKRGVTLTNTCRLEKVDDDGPVVVNTEELEGHEHREDAAAATGLEDDVPPELRAYLPMSFGAPARDITTSAGALRHMAVHNGPSEGQPGEATLPKESSVPACNEKTGEQQANNDGDDDAAIGPYLPHATFGAAVNANPWHLPISSEAILQPHARAVVAVDLDHSGSRLLTGSTDYTVKIFDFNGMKSDCRPFRSLEPSDGHPIVALSWSPTGDGFLVITGSPQPKVYDRDGKEQGEFPRGDMYIRDMKNTKGHIGACSGGAWHPTDKATGMTCSDDGTVRIWDMWTLEQKTVIKPTLAKPGRVSVTAATYGTDGRLIAAGLNDGAIQLWDVRGKFGQSAAIGVVPQPKAQGFTKQAWSYVSRGSSHLVRNAHEAGSEITCLKFSLDGHTLLSRSTDETLKVWDVRALKSPVVAIDGLPTTFSNTQCCFSPDEKLVLTGISAGSKESVGAVCFFDRSDLSLVRRLAVPGSAVALTWHSEINQIVVGCGDRKEGTARVLYDPGMSRRGALQAVGRRPRKETMSDFTAEIEPRIYNPNALPLFREAWPGGNKRKQPVDASVRTSKSFKPEKGQAGPGTSVGAGGKLGTSGGTLLTQYIMKHHGQLKNPAEEDVRASILRHAGKEDAFSRFTEAYAATQPQRIYAKEEEEEEGDVDDQPPPPA